MKNGKLTHFLMTAYLSFAVGNSSPLNADDTEIYLDTPPTTTSAANILFNLDTSGSMGNAVDENNNGVIDDGERIRMDVLKEAMNTVLDSLPALNAGIMRYHYYGGPILYPVAHLDELACVIEDNCTTSSPTTGILTVTTVLTDDGDNDAEQAGSGAVTLDRMALDMGWQPAGSCSTTSGSVRVDSSEDDAESSVANSGYTRTSSDLEIPRVGSSQQVVGMRFQNVPIPAGSTITDARIVFTIDSTPSSYNAPVDLVVVGESMSGSRVQFSSGNQPEDRLANPTSATVDWETDEFPPVNATLTTSNISAIVDELVNDAAWPATGGDDIVLLIGQDPGAPAASNGSREVEAYNGEQESAPLLTYTYQTCDGTPADVRTGLRFTEVDVPQGSTITGARIDFISTTTEGGNPSLRVKMQDANDAEPFAVDTPFTARTFLTTNVPWTTTSTPVLDNPWTVDTTHSTPDLAALVQDVVNRPGWCGGNDMMFMIERSGGSQALRTAYSSEAENPSPVLTLTYNADSPQPGANSCTRSTVVKLVTTGIDDVEQQTSGFIFTTSNDLEMVEESSGNLDQIVGLRFRDIPIAQNAVITSAKLVFTAKATDSVGTTLTIEGQLSPDASVFSNTTNSLSDTSTRPRTAASATWSPAPWSIVGQQHEAEGLEGIVQEIVNQASWSAGNSLALFVSGNGKRNADSYERDAATAPRLEIKFEGTPATTSKTVRGRLKDIVDELVHTGSTPISGTMLEAAYYFRGEGVRFGRQRGNQFFNYKRSRVSHAASYDANGATVTFPFSCTEDNLDHNDCRFQVISGGTPTYKSPIVAECQSNYLVNLTDGGGFFTGSGNSNTLGQSIDEQVLINSLQAQDSSGSPVSLTNCASDTTLPDDSIYSGSAHNECTVKLAQFLHDNDQIYTNTQNLQSGTAPMDGVQSLDIYTIGFNLCGSGNVTSLNVDNEQVCCPAANHNATTGICSAPIADPNTIEVLKAQAAVADGEYFNANTVDDLVAAFTKITSDILAKDTSFVAPSIAANAFNRLFSRDEVYFGLFEPSKKVHWDGNVKKYNVCVDPDPDNDGTDDCVLGDLLDNNLINAIVDNTAAIDDGLFKTTSQSVWSNGIDGRETQEGGAGGEITDYTARTVHTEYKNPGGTAPNGTSLGGTGYFIDSTNWADPLNSAVRDEVCPDPTVLTAGSDCENRMLWMLGADILNEDEDSATDTRWWFHDVLHSSPVTVTYGQDASDDFIDKILVGTNEGGLHFINGATGEEEWVFMPNSVLANQQSLFDDTGATHIYGLDSTAVVIVDDANLDGTIDPATDFVGAVITQRRGGENLYALDLTPAAELTSNTDTVTPKFLWHISPSTSGFSRLGQTWSEPQLVHLDAVGGPVTALIFGGGYDTDLDEDDGSGDSRNFGVEGGDPNAGNAIYVVDAQTGALIFSVSGTASGANIEVPEMKYAIPSNVTAFDSDGDGFEDRVYVGDTAGQVWRLDLHAVNPASIIAPQGDSVVGLLANISDDTSVANERRFFYRPTVVQVIDYVYSDAAGGEYDYVLLGSGNRANPLDTEVSDRFYAFRDINTGGMGDSDGNNIANDYPQNTDASDLGTPISHSELVDISSSVLDGTTAATQTALGWYFDFGSSTDGQKVLAPPGGVFGGTLIFTTYVPATETSTNPCQPAEGSGVAYNLDILSTAATIDWDEDGTLEPIDDRAATLGSGIPSEAVPAFTKEGVTILVGTGGGAENLGKVVDLPRFNTYWYEENF
jgi:type IV pilus assembly protein PilY1